MKKNILILLAIGVTIWFTSCSKNKENLIPAPSVTIDTTFNYIDDDGNPGVFSKKGDVVIPFDSVTDLTFDLFLNAGATLQQVDIQLGGGAATNTIQVFNSNNQPFTRIINDVDGWWPNFSYNGGFDSAKSSVMTIVIPKAKGDIILNAIVHDETGKQGYLTKKIVLAD